MLKSLCTLFLWQDYEGQNGAKTALGSSGKNQEPRQLHGQNSEASRFSCLQPSVACAECKKQLNQTGPRQLGVQGSSNQVLLFLTYVSPLPSSSSAGHPYLQLLITACCMDMLLMKARSPGLRRNEWTDRPGSQPSAPFPHQVRWFCSYPHQAMLPSERTSTPAASQRRFGKIRPFVGHSQFRAIVFLQLQEKENVMPLKL